MHLNPKLDFEATRPGLWVLKSLVQAARPPGLAVSKSLGQAARLLGLQDPWSDLLALRPSLQTSEPGLQAPWPFPIPLILTCRHLAIVSGHKG